MLHGVSMLKMGVKAICSLALGVPFSNTGPKVWENQDQVVILEPFYADKKQYIAKLLIGFGYELLKPWPDSNRHILQAVIVQTTAKQTGKLLAINLQLFLTVVEKKLSQGSAKRKKSLCVIFFRPFVKDTRL